MMQVTGIRIERGQQVLVDGLDFSVPAGSALMLRGPNGSGKSTLLRALLDIRETGLIRRAGTMIHNHARRRKTTNQAQQTQRQKLSEHQ